MSLNKVGAVILELPSKLYFQNEWKKKIAEGTVLVDYSPWGRRVGHNLAI